MHRSTRARADEERRAATAHEEDEQCAARAREEEERRRREAEWQRWSEEERQHPEEMDMVKTKAMTKNVLGLL